MNDLGLGLGSARSRQPGPFGIVSGFLAYKFNEGCFVFLLLISEEERDLKPVFVILVSFGFCLSSALGAPGECSGLVGVAGASFYMA